MLSCNEYIINSIKTLNDSVSEILLSPIDLKNKLEFLPGQHVYVKIGDKNLPYSMASSPLDEQLKFLISNGKNNQNLDCFQKESIVHISEPQGEAYYKDSDNHILAVSKGLGIAPVMSIIDYLAAQPDAENKKISLYNVVPFENDLLFEDYFKSKQSQIDLEYKNFITEGNYNLENLYKNFADMHYNLNRYDFYVYGSKLFVLDIYKELLPYCKDNFYSDVNIAI